MAGWSAIRKLSPENGVTGMCITGMCVLTNRNARPTLTENARSSYLRATPGGWLMWSSETRTPIIRYAFLHSDCT
jgi:hypothetical protein